MMLSKKNFRLFLIISLALLTTIGLKAQDVQILLDSLHINKKQRDCKYLENLYDIGNCYIESKQYSKAEYYYRKVIIESDILNIDCAIKKKTLAKMAKLYNATGYPTFADYCTSLIDNDVEYESVGDYYPRMHELTTLYDVYTNQRKNEERVQTITKLLDHIENYRGKMNDDYITYAQLFASILSRDLNKKNEAAVLNREIIEIGESLKTYHRSVYFAYEDYIKYLSENNTVDSLNIYLPKAVQYLHNSNDTISFKRNLYEEVGCRLCEADNYEEGIKYLEKSWYGEVANSFYSLTMLGVYYLEKDISRAIFYYSKAAGMILDGLKTGDKNKERIFETLANLYINTNNYSEATKYAGMAEDLIAKNEDTNIYADFLSIWAVHAVNAHDVEKASNMISKMVSMMDSLSDESKANVYYSCGYFHIQQSNYDKAIDSFDKAIELINRLYGEKEPFLFYSHHFIGISYLRKGNKEKALQYLNKSKDLQLGINGEVMQDTELLIKECLTND